MQQVNAANETGSMPIPMALEPKPSNDTSSTVTSPKQAQAKAAASKRDRAFFAKELQKATFVFYRSAKAVADLLLDARLTLSPEEFQKFINEDCQFDSSLVYKFIKMAADFRLNDPNNQLLLPEEWTLRYEIMMMAEKTFRIGVTKGIIHRNCKLADLKALREKMEEPKRKKASTKAKATGKDSTAAAEAPKPTPAATKAEEPKRAAVKAAVNNPGLRVVENASAAESANTGTTATATAPATATTTAMGRIAIVVSQEVLDQHKTDLDGLMASIEALVKDYDFIGGVELEVA
jgi:hypothetical protein